MSTSRVHQIYLQPFPPDGAIILGGIAIVGLIALAVLAAIERRQRPRAR